MTLIQSESGKRSYRYLPYIISIYSFFFILPSLLLHKIVNLPILGAVPISILFTGIYFVLLDIVTEVYGYRQARALLLSGLVTYSIFVFIMEVILRIPSPQNYHAAWSLGQDPNVYIYLFNNLHLVWFSVVICTLFANNLNAILLSKWKVLVQGKYFWIRSMTTSLMAAIIYSTLSNFFAFGLFLSHFQTAYFFKLTLISISAKLFTLFVFAYPSVIFCELLKRKEGVDVYDHDLSFNPFKSQTIENL